MEGEFFLADQTEFDANPAAHSGVRRNEVLFRRGMNQFRLENGRCRYPYRDVAVVVVIVGKHHADLFAAEKNRFAVRWLFHGIGKSGADSPHPAEVFLGRAGLMFFRHKGFIASLTLNLPIVYKRSQPTR